ncbi:MAG: PEP-CTERM sorting domain-containing protein [Opitutaceae bacterium]|jgi:hypothetical protein
MNKKFIVSALAALVLPSFALAQDTTLAGWTFSQFLGAGYPSVDGSSGDPVNSIVATYRGATDPDINQVDGTLTIQSGATGYTDPSIGSWSFASFNTSNGVDVRADTFGALNFQNSVTLDGKDMSLSDSAGMMLTFNTQNTLWSIQVNDTAGYTNASVGDFTFAARGNGGTATVEWLLDGAVFATSLITSDGFNTYSLELDSSFYGSGLIEGRLTSGSVSFDNAQFNGAAIPEPSSYAALAGVAGLVLAAYRRRRAV